MSNLKELNLKDSEIVIGTEAKPKLYFYVGDSYNGTGQATRLGREEAIKLVNHLSKVFGIKADQFDCE